jgi:hypothetical protein
MTEKAKQLGECIAFGFSNDDREVVVSAISKREYFAGLAMQALIASETEDSNYGHFSNLAEYAVKRANALLEELSKIE